jgi:hypothetical protein
MKKQVHITIAIMMCCAIALQTTASPTENEFEPCRLLAAKTLDRCLMDNNSHNNDVCWSDSKTAYTSCREEIFFSHVVKIRKAKKAAEQQKQESEQ